jgi:hypothetical protein
MVVWGYLKNVWVVSPEIPKECFIETIETHGEKFVFELYLC